MNTIDWKKLSESEITIRDLYQGAFQIKMKAEQLTREGKNSDDLYRSEYHIISALSQIGDPASMILLGEMLQGNKVPGLNVEDPVKEAVELWQKAADNGEARGYTNIGLVYLHRSVPGGGNNFENIEYDRQKALGFFLKGYENGDSKAGRHIGLCYRDGIGTEADPVLAYDYFCKAAERHDSTARYLKAECLYYGKGVTQDKEQALKIMQELIDENAHDAPQAAEFIKSHR